MSSRLTEFFESPNRVASDPDDPVSALVGRALAQQSPNVLILPWDDGRWGLRWYVLSDEDDVEQTREELLAHVGVSYTDFVGQDFVMDPGDPGDLALASLEVSRHTIRIDLLDTSNRRRVSDAFERFLDMWERRPPPPSPPARSPAEILTDYRLALLGGRRDEADSAIAELRADGTLEFLNTRFLELEVVAGFDGPQAVLAHPSLRSLLTIRRPARVSDLIAVAVDRVHLRPDSSRSPDEIVARFETLDASLRDLITSAGECRSSSGVLLLALRTRARGESVADALSTLGERLAQDDATRELIEALSSQRKEPSVAEENLAELLARGQYDSVLAQAQELLEPDLPTVDAALRAAQWLDSLEAAQVALRVFDAASAEVQERFLEHRLLAPLVASLRSLIPESDAAVNDWVQFFDRLEKKPDWADAIDVAAHGAVEWTLGSVIDDPQQLTYLAEYISKGPSFPGPTFSRVVPYVIEWASRATDDQRLALKDLHEALIVHLSLYDTSRGGLELLGRFAAEVLAAGMDEDAYDFMLSNLEERWRVSRSPNALLWAADVIETVLDSPAPVPSRRETFVAKVLQLGADAFSRAESGVVELLNSLAGELRLGHLVPLPTVEEAPPEPSRDLQGIAIALYSLTEPALQRAEVHLQRRWPGVRIVTRSDHVGSEELANVARTADLFVVATRSAKHAATDFIRARRGPGLATRNAAGKGSASLITEAEAWLAAG
jgi:hypothetical protein